MATQHSRAKEHLIDHGNPRCDSADGVLFSQLSKVSRAPQRRSAVSGLTTPAESNILPGRQDDSIRGPRQHATHDARIWIQLELSQSLPGPFSSLDPHLAVNQGDQAVQSPLTRGCSSRFLAQPGNQLSLREPPDTLDRIVRRRRELASQFVDSTHRRRPEEDDAQSEGGSFQSVEPFVITRESGSSARRPRPDRIGARNHGARLYLGAGAMLGQEADRRIAATTDRPRFATGLLEPRGTALGYREGERRSAHEVPVEPRHLAHQVRKLPLK